jgi:hypothetical protein
MKSLLTEVAAVAGSLVFVSAPTSTLAKYKCDQPVSTIDRRACEHAVEAGDALQCRYLPPTGTFPTTPST